MHPARALTLALLCALFPSAHSRAQDQPPAPPPPPGRAPLPHDPALTLGALPNGLRYAVLHRPASRGPAEVWLHVHSGSLQESDDTRGAAHLLQHMAFHGSADFPAAAVAPFYESLAMAFVQHDVAFSTLDQSVYRLALPDAQPATLDKSFRFLADIAARLQLPEDQLEPERAALVQESRRGITPEHRTAERILARALPDSLIAQRPPAGLDRTILALTRDDLAAFYARTYVAPNITLEYVGDADPALVIERLTAAFNPLPAAPAPAPVDPAVRATEGLSALVIPDRNSDGAVISILRTAPPAPPVRTIRAWRRQLAERLAAQAFDRRMDEKASLARVAFREADAHVGQTGTLYRQAEVRVRADPARWHTALAEALAEIRDARARPFTAEELAAVRAAAAQSASRVAAADAGRPPAMMIRFLNDAVSSGDAFLSAAQELDIGSRILPGIPDEEISLAFAELFDDQNALVVLTLPDAAGVTDADVLAAARGDPDRSRAEAPAPRRALLAELPQGGDVADSARHVPSSVRSLWLSNNVRVHIRFMSNRQDSFTLTATLPGGELRETASNRAVSRAAAEAFRAPATSTRSGADLRAALEGSSVTTSGAAAADAIVLTITARPDDDEAAMQLAYLLLTDPRLEPAALDAWKARQLAARRQADSDPRGTFALLLPDLLYPLADPRPRPPTPGQIESVSLDAAQAWLTEAVRSAPLEVAIVGDLDEGRAVKLATRYLGALPQRPRITPDLFKDLRAMPAPDGPRSLSREIDSAAPRAQVLAGFLGPDASNVRDTRLLSLAARVLTTRLTTSLRDEQKLVPSIAASVIPAEIYPGHGLFFVGAPADPLNVDAVQHAVTTTFTQFAIEGPAEEEMKALHRQVTSDTGTQLLEPAYWTQVLRDLDYHATSLDDVVDAPAALVGYTAQEIRDAFAKYLAAEPPLQLMVTPRPGAPK